MKVVIITVGTLGDTAPFIGLGARLQAAGHHVTVAAQGHYEAPIREAGLEFRNMPGDIRTELASENGQRLHRASSWFSALPATLRLAEKLLSELGEGIARAAQGAEVLLVHRIALVHGHLVARAMGIPLLVFELFPSGLAPTGEFLPANLGPASLGGWGNRSVYGLLRKSAGLSKSFLASLDDFQAKLGSTRLDPTRLYAQMDEERWPIYHAFSSAVVPRPKDWRPGLEIIGYLWPERSLGWQPPAPLVDFLAAGPAPVFIGLGSLIPEGAEQLAELLVAAVRQAKVRAVIQSGWGNLATSARHDDVLPIGSVPHDWLFPHMAAVVHAAGAGVTGAGLRAGVPAVPVPAMNDQPFWAQRLVRIGASPGGLRFQKLSANHLGQLIGRAVSEPSYRRAAQSVSEQIRTEDGSGHILGALASLTNASAS